MNARGWGRFVMLAIAGLSAASALRADEPDTLGSGTGALQGAEVVRPSPDRAALYSLLATGIPVGVGLLVEDRNRTQNVVWVVAGLVAGPSAGYFYGRCPGRGLLGVAGRSAIVVVSLYAMGLSLSGSDLVDLDPFIVGGVALAGAAAYDILVVEDHVSRRNARVSWYPILREGEDGAPTLGAAVRLDW